ncbi:MAG: deaminase [Bdellovibrionales bacterium]
MPKKKPSKASYLRSHDAWLKHRRWLERASQISEQSVDKGGSPHPYVKVGAVLVDARGREIAASANRFAQGVDRRRAERTKDKERSLWINCAEQLVLMQALRKGRKVAGAKLYVTLEPCAVCAGLIAELRIAEVIVPINAMRRYAKLKTKWKDSIEIGLTKLQESGVKLISVDTRKLG